MLSLHTKQNISNKSVNKDNFPFDIHNMLLVSLLGYVQFAFPCQVFFNRLVAQPVIYGLSLFIIKHIYFLLDNCLLTFGIDKYSYY